MGYVPFSLFVPHVSYGISREPLETMDEFRDMVKALHRSGIEAILDIVYGHTGEEASGFPA